jgi:uncharacterized protein (DUF1800 family)
MGVVLAGLVLLADWAQAGTFLANSTGEVAAIKRKVLAAEFLSRTTFGPKMAEITALATRIQQIGHKAACEEWINQQLAITPPTNHWPIARQMVIDNGWSTELTTNGTVSDYYRYKEYAWWHTALTANDQLRQRVAWAMSQIFVVATGPSTFDVNTALDFSGNPYWLGLPHYYDNVLLKNAFGTYRQLIEDMTLHPVMGVWLSSVRNRKATGSTEPDENYAREILQLFSIGLLEMQKNGEYRRDSVGNTIDTYDIDTIKALARVFTGMVYNNGAAANSSGAATNLHAAMEMYASYHDYTAKTAFKGNLAIPARSATEANGLLDISNVLNHLAYKHPNTAPFLSRRLIQRLVKSNPSKNYIRRVASVFDSGNGDFPKMIKAVLLDSEALDSLTFVQTRSPLGIQVRTRGTEYTRLREPVLRYTAMFRAFDASYTPPAGAGNYFFISNDDVRNYFDQAPYNSPSVFNFYLPDYRPPNLDTYVPSSQLPNGQIVAPEFQIMTAVQANRIGDRLRAEIIDSDLDSAVWIKGQASRTAFRIVLDLAPIYSGMLGPQGTEPTVAQLDDMMEYLDLLLCHGTLNETVKQAIFAACVNEVNTRVITQNTGTDLSKENLVRGAVWSVLVSPGCAVSE